MGAERSNPSEGERAYAAFRMWGPGWPPSETAVKATLDPDDVTAVLGIEPTRSHRRGEARPPRKAPGRYTEPWPNGLWLLSSKDMIVSRELGDHLRWILDRIEPVAGKIAAYVAEHEVGADFFCYQDIYGNSVVYIEQQLLGRLSRIGQGIGIDIYCMTADED